MPPVHRLRAPGRRSGTSRRAGGDFHRPGRSRRRFLRGKLRRLPWRRTRRHDTRTLADRAVFHPALGYADSSVAARQYPVQHAAGRRGQHDRRGLPQRRRPHAGDERRRQRQRCADRRKRLHHRREYFTHRGLAQAHGAARSPGSDRGRQYRGFRAFHAAHRGNAARSRSGRLAHASAQFLRPQLQPAR